MRRFTGRPVALALASIARGPPHRFTSNGGTANGKGESELKSAVEGDLKAATKIPQAGHVLPGEDLARRAVTPNQEFPATWSAEEPLDAADPRVLWREHYALDDSKPYYQNVRTNEVTYTIPEGFVTRFPKLYAKAGYRLDARGAVFSTADSRPPSGSVSEAAQDADTTGKECSGGTGATAAPKDMKNLTIKQKLAAYGGGGLLWYLIVHNISLLGVFTCLYIFRIDLVAIAVSYGFKIKRSEQVEEINEPKKRPPFVKTFVLSIVLNKILVPIHLFVTLTTAPFLVPRLEPVAVSLLPKFRSFVSGAMAKFTSTTA